MSDELEEIIKSMPLKEPSSALDDRINAIFQQEQPVEEPQELPPVKAFPWQKVLTYAVAAMLFLSIGITELMRRSNNTTPDVNTITQNDKDDNSKAVETLKVSTSRSQGNIALGEPIEHDNGKYVKPVMKRVIIKKTHFDKEKNMHIEVEVPNLEIIFVPMTAE